MNISQIWSPTPSQRPLVDTRLWPNQNLQLTPARRLVIAQWQTSDFVLPIKRTAKS